MFPLGERKLRLDGRGEPFCPALWAGDALAFAVDGDNEVSTAIDAGLGSEVSGPAVSVTGRFRRRVSASGYAIA